MEGGNMSILKDCDFLGYLPVKLEGINTSTPAVRPLPEKADSEKNRIFQFDEAFTVTRASKLEAMNERIDKYYQNIYPTFLDMEGQVCEYIVNTLLFEYPHLFELVTVDHGEVRFDCKLTNDKIYFKNNPIWGFEYLYTESWQAEYNPVSGLDALAMNVQEDLVVHQLQPQDRALAIHLCNANGWSAEGFIGKSFEDIHKDVTKKDGSLVIPNPEKFAQRLINFKTPIERVGAISFRTEPRLNRHPNDAPSPKFVEMEEKELYFRFERQTVTPFKDLGIFLFTIKTYFADLKGENRDMIKEAMNTGNSEIYSRWFLDEYGEEVLKWVNS